MQECIRTIGALQRHRVLTFKALQYSEIPADGAISVPSNGPITSGAQNAQNVQFCGVLPNSQEHIFGMARKEVRAVITLLYALFMRGSMTGDHVACRLPMRPAVQPTFRAPRMGARGSMALVALRSLQSARALF